MKHKIIRIAAYYLQAFHNHLASWWYSFFLGHVGDGTVIYRHCRLEGDKLENISIGDSCLIDSNCVLGCRAVLLMNGENINPVLMIGNRCNIGQYNHITAVNKIIIGDNLLTGRFVLISDNSHGSFNIDDLKLPPSQRAIVSKGEVVIGNNVWLGDKVSILPGVHIGDGCIIGANSVVTNDIPPYCVAAGIPARIIKSIYEKR